MCDLDTVSAGSLAHPVITVQLESTRVDRVDTSEMRPVGDGEVGFARSPVSSSSSREDCDVPKQEAILPVGRPRSVSMHSPRDRPATRDHPNLTRLSKSKANRNSSESTGSSSHPRSMSMNLPAKPKLCIKRSTTIELANAWASDSELESGLESDTSNSGLSPNPSQEWVTVQQDDSDGHWPELVSHEHCEHDADRPVDGDVPVELHPTSKSMSQCPTDEGTTSERHLLGSQVRATVAGDEGQISCAASTVDDRDCPEGAEGAAADERGEPPGNLTTVTVSMFFF